MCAIDNWMTSDAAPPAECRRPHLSVAGASDMGCPTGGSPLIEGRCFTVWEARPQHNPACG